MEKINPRLKQPAEHALFFKRDRDIHGGGQGKKRKKRMAAEPMNFLNAP